VASDLPEQKLNPVRILLVEDHRVTAEIMRTILTEAGHTVEMREDVATALKLADEQAFDLLMSDLGLPDGSGHDLLRELRERGHALPAIALSGYGQEEDIERSCAAGFAAHLVKPASRESVLAAVAEVITASGGTAAGKAASSP
jgi:two-component system CheB/CheR fusion protein